MRRFIFALVLSAGLSACAPAADVSTTLRNAVSTASGTLNDVSSKGKAAVQPIIETANSIKERAQNVEEGLQKISDGKKQVIDSLTR